MQQEQKCFNSTGDKSSFRGSSCSRESLSPLDENMRFFEESSSANFGASSNGAMKSSRSTNDNFCQTSERFSPTADIYSQESFNENSTPEDENLISFDDWLGSGERTPGWRITREAFEQADKEQTMRDEIKVNKSNHNLPIQEVCHFQSKLSSPIFISVAS